MRKTCGLDIHKDTIFCAIYNGKAYSEVKEYRTFTDDITSMCNYLISEKVVEVAMESTGIYFIPVYDLMLSLNFKLTVVNPFQIKQMPGRKSDVKDAQWIANLLHKKMLQSSFMPDERIQALRSYMRMYRKIQQRITNVLQTMDTILITAGIRISSCVSNLSGKSVQNIVTALIDGERNPDELCKFVYHTIKAKKDGTLKSALSGNVKEHHIEKLRWKKEEHDLLQRQAEECLEKAQIICLEHYGQQFRLVTTLDGVSIIAAMSIIAETGGDMTVFDNSGKLSGWAGLHPRNDESAGQYKSTAITKGNKYLKAILVQCAWAASRTKGSFFKEKFNRLAMRKSRKKALVAIARKMLVVIWNMLKEKKEYNPHLIPVYDTNKLSAKIKYHQREMLRIEKLL